MSTIGAVKAFPVSMATLATLTSAIDVGGSYKRMLIEIPTMVSGTDIYIQGSNKIDGTFRRIYQSESSSGTRTNVPLAFGSAITNCLVGFVPVCQFIKLEFTTAATANAHSFKVVGCV